MVCVRSGAAPSVPPLPALLGSHADGRRTLPRSPCASTPPAKDMGNPDAGSPSARTPRAARKVSLPLGKQLSPVTSPTTRVAFGEGPSSPQGCTERARASRSFQREDQSSQDTGSFSVAATGTSCERTVSVAGGHACEETRTQATERPAMPMGEAKAPARVKKVCRRLASISPLEDDNGDHKHSRAFGALGRFKTLPERAKVDLLGGLVQGAHDDACESLDVSCTAARQGEFGVAAAKLRSLKLNVNRDVSTIERLGSSEKIFDRYTWDKVIQEDGDGGKVVICHPIGDATPLVMKMKTKASVNADFASEEDFRSNLEVLVNLPRHPNLVELLRILEDDKFFFTVMECANGGSLLPALVKCYPSGAVPRETIKSVFADILRGLQHVHAYGILHRDIKPDNIVVDFGNAEENLIYINAMICDFDHAGLETFGGAVSSLYGTDQFRAPECFCLRITRKSDLYSTGVILFLLVTGSLPYPDELFVKSAKPTKNTPACVDLWRRQVYHNLLKTKVEWRTDVWPAGCNQTGFCKKMMSFYCNLRPEGAADALRHAFFGNSDQKPEA
eukprot:TRINITY_DN4981_c0_g1_i1.p1 TRINITY_DN4981_c0_g1~~TRINITY_DN4981_c0_g1_i1.p1  ORF type:complete len:575 (-),score=74.09 TRINITY_DN4981_c0_g1_i1:90-1772(-)